MKNKKRIICSLLCFMMFLCSVVTLTSCGGCKHSWSSWEVVNESTCTTTGKKQRKCSKCQETEEDVIEISGHKFGEWNEEVSANCMVAGIKAHKNCSTCGKNFDANGNEISDLTISVNSSAHSFGNWTSNGDGTHTRVCSNNSEHIETLSCNGGSATCKEKAVCVDCKTAYGNYATHEFGEWSEEIPANCMVTGTKAHKDCLVCNKHFDETENEILDLTIAVDSSAHDMATKVENPTCVDQGYTLHYCKNQGCEYSYKDTYVDANGHDWSGVVSCTTGRECLTCGESEPELGHNHMLMHSGEATCEAKAFEFYKCSRCEDHYTYEFGEPNGHNISGVTPTETHIEGCKYQLVYKCNVNDCGKDVLGDIIHHHTFKASVSIEATCMKDGEKLLTCESCGHTETEVIKKNTNGHIWNDGVLDTNTNIRTFHCVNKDADGHNCIESKTTIDASKTNSAGVSSSDLGLAGGGVQLESAELEFDNTALGSLANKDLIISSEILTGDDLSNALSKLTEDEIKQLAMVSGANPVIYNFTVAENENPDKLIETFNDGFVTIRLKYTPEDEDIDSIAVWYISGGKPVSIEAEYSNGYITFKTNHFSEYTVTRLTPAERCKLYGCVYKETEFEGNCLQDGYILKLCIRCHTSHKEITKVAKGHKYTETITPATCENSGKIDYNCENCQYHYSKIIAKLNHNYEIVEQKEATCESSGFIKYGCTNDNCESGRIITIPQLSHKIVNENVPATCEQHGYIYSKCENCTYEQTIITGPALGHNYSSSFEWESDYSSAKLILTCLNNKEHVVEKDAIVEKTTIPATCTSKELVTYKAVVSVDGKVYQDTKEVVGEKLDHTYLDKWYHSNTQHWKECSCGETSYVENHKFDDGVFEKEPTCQDEGTKKYTCECGYEKLETIQPTYEHTYENGKCTGCGKEEESCDHNNLKEVTINLSDYGCCEGTIVYKVCDCGEVCLIDTEALNKLACDMQETSVDQGTDSNGNRYMIMEGRCSVCGLEAKISYYGELVGCEQKVKCYYEIKVKDKILLENAYSEVVYSNHNTNYETISLSDYTNCGTTLNVEKCLTCGEITRIHNINNNCDGEYKETTITDENGIEHTIHTMTCKKCNLIFESDEYYTSESTCHVKRFSKVSIYNGSVVLYTYLSEDDNYSHEYETTVEMLGESCEDGVIITKHCSRCGSGYTDKRYEHSEFEEVEIELKEHSCCSGKLYVEKCTICNEIVRLSNYEGECDIFSYEDTSSYLDDNNIEHTVTTKTCKVCGLKWIEDSYEVEVNGCNVTKNVTTTFTINDTVIVSFVELRNDSRHDFQYTYIDDDSDCETGYTLLVSCSYCNMSFNMQGMGHKYNEEHLSFEDKDCCGLKIFVSACEICNKVDNILNVKVEANCQFEMFEDEIKDDFGNVKLVAIQTCNKCGLTINYSRWSNKVSCVEEVNYQIVVTLNNEELYSNIFKEITENHDYSYSYSFENGNNCDDGYTITMTCSTCGHTKTENGSGHRYKFIEQEFSKNDKCGIYFSVNQCEICEHTEMINLETIDFRCKPNEEITSKEIVDGNGITHYVIEFYCTECLRFYKLDVWVEPVEGCTVKQYQSIKIVDGTDIIFDNTQYEIKTEHDYHYEYQFLSYDRDCDKGYMVTETCSNCSHREQYTSSGHREKQTEIDLSDFGICGGHINKTECEICGKVISEYAYDYCGWQNLGNNENNQEVYYCEKCNTYKYISRVEGGKVENCSYSIKVITIYCLEDGTELLRLESFETYTNHNFTYSVELKGKTCEDGYIVTKKCSACEFEETFEDNYHNTMIETKYSFDDYENICGGEVVVYKCPCELVARYELEKLSCNLEYYNSMCEEDENGIWHNFTIFKCRDCDLMQIVDDYSTREGCNYINYNKATFVKILNDADYPEILLELTFVNDMHSEHNFVVQEFELFGNDCNDGFMVHQTCTKCGETSNHKSYGHEQFRMLLVDLEKEGACAGKIYKIACPCDEYKDIELNIECDYVYEDSSYTENGIEYLVNIYRCRKCGLEIEYKRFRTVLENCMAKDTTIMTVKINNVQVYSTTIESGEYGYHDFEISYKLNGESCDDGVEVTEKCKNCEESNTYYISGHEQHTDFEYNLKDYNCCDGKIIISSCVCGMYTELRFFEYTNCIFRDEYYEETINGKYCNVRIMTCENCNLTIKAVNYEILEGCKVFNCTEYTISTQSETILDNYIIKYYSYDRHNESITHKLHGETCEDGVDITFTCERCGQTREEYYNHHYVMDYESYDLSEYSECGGYFSVSKCPCGQEFFINKHFNSDICTTNTYVDEDGNYHNVESITCKNCGLRFEDDSCIIYDRENCTEITNHKIYLVVGDLIVVKEYINSREKHTILTKTEFLSSVKNCEQGVTLYQTCKYCDYEHSETFYYHHEFDYETINLKDYGSVCDGYVVYRACACEKYGSMNLDYATCEFEQNSTFMWVDNYIIGEYDREYGAYIYTCAVTDPENCGFKIRYAYYYVRYDDLCYDIKYERWQFGYNEFTNEFEYEIIYEVGRELEHKYVDSEETKIDENGKVLIDKHICKNCGSGRITKEYYNNENLLYKEEIIYYDKNLETGETSESLNIHEYIYHTTSKGEIKRFPTRVYSEYKYNGVKNNFSETTYEYDFTFIAPFGTDSYKVIEKQNDNYGNNFEIEKHKTYYEYEYRNRFYSYDWYDYDDRNWFILYEYSVQNKGTDYEDWYCIERSYKFDIETPYGVKAHEITIKESGSYRENITRVFAEFYYTVDEDVDEDSDWYTLHSYNIYNEGTDNEMFTREDYSYDFNYNAPFGKNAYEETIIYSDSNGENYTISHASSKVDSIMYGQHYYTYYFYEYKIQYEGTDREYWYRYDYTYEFENGCKKTTKFSDSTEYYSENTEDYHKELIQGDSNIKEPTCTQFGIGSWVCEICKLHQQEYEIYPICHSWEYDYISGMYICTICELENLNGASGEIVMEDFTEEYGNETNYVVGYFNKDGVQFTYYIALIDPLTEEEIILPDLNYIDYSDLGIVALGVSKEEIKLMAENMGYDVSNYLVKLSFVPIGSDSVLDYAITFDSELKNDDNFDDKYEFTAYIDSFGNVFINDVFFGYLIENKDIIDDNGIVIAFMYDDGSIYDVNGFFLAKANYNFGNNNGNYDDIFNGSYEGNNNGNNNGNSGNYEGGYIENVNGSINDKVDFNNGFNFYIA